MSVYLDAIKALETRGWHQGGLTGPGGSVCMAGALNVAATGRPSLCGAADAALDVLNAAHDALFAELGRWPKDFNDDPSTSYEDVVLALKRAHEASEEAS